MTSQPTTISNPQPLAEHMGQALAGLLLRLVPEPPVWLAPLIDQLCAAVNQGHSCLELPRIERRQRLADGSWQDLPFPPLPELIDQLQQLQITGDPSSQTPLILDLSGSVPRLYLYRYWAFEVALASNIEQSAKDQHQVDSALLTQWLDQLFDLSAAAKSENTDWQLIAAVSALFHRFCVISGGPGTGKTTTVIKILALLSALSEQALKIALAAPTGKAAGRLEESIRQAIVKLGDSGVLDEQLIEKLPQKATTLHRLLGVREFSNDFRHGVDNPLQLDLLVVDESSMVDLALMYRLVSALPKNCRLILLGDRNQLASVEAGSVLADICSLRPFNCFNREFAGQLQSIGISLPERAIADQPLALPGNIVLLEKSWRFDAQSAIGQLATAVNQANPDQAQQLLLSDSWPDIQWLDPQLDTQAAKALDHLLLENYQSVLKAESAAAAHRAFEQFRVLAAVRNGNFGVSGLNRRIERLFARYNMLEPGNPWYQGRPIIIAENDYALDLYNGDIGICWPDQDGRPRVWFPLADGSLRQVSPARLPQHQTAWAMTVHKSQGSEFLQCLLVLPEKHSPVISRDLLYTAITRAKRQFSILATRQMLSQAIRQQQQRFSGLADKLL